VKHLHVSTAHVQCCSFSEVSLLYSKFSYWCVAGPVL